MNSLARIVVLLGSACLLGAMWNGLSDGGIPLWGPEEAWRVRGPIVVPRGAEQVDLAAFRSAIEAGATIIDARSEKDYAEGHVPGALSFPGGRISERLARVFETIDPEAAVVVYCAGVSCNSSLTVYRRLEREGYKKIRVFTGGWNEWKEKGLAIETGPPPDDEGVESDPSARPEGGSSRPAEAATRPVDSDDSMPAVQSRGGERAATPAEGPLP